MIKKLTSLLLVLFFLVSLPVTAQAATKKAIKPYAEKLIQYYFHHQTAAEDVIWDILNQMEQVDASQAAVWENIMEDWAWVNDGMPISENVLPDGLPEDDSLCIVVLGFGLKEDGSMKEELIDRLVVALSSALKYPNAFIAVTGGQTSPVEGVTEAGQMSAWLKKKGIDPGRIIVENQSLSTTANAVNVYKMLNKSYPQVDSIALISSDYHISWGGAMFTTVSDYNFGYKAGNPIDILAAAVCDTGTEYDSMAYQAWGVSTITGVEFDENAPAPALYFVDRPTEPETLPTEAPEPQEEHHWFWEKPENQHEAQTSQTGEQERKKPYWIPVALGVVALAAVYVLTPKKPRKKRKKPEFKWEE